MTPIRLAPLLALAIPSATLSAHPVLNELVVSTAGADAEFVELYHPGPEAVDLQGWTLEVFESDAGEDFGKLDRSHPFAAGTLEAGDHLLLANAMFVAGYGIEADHLLPNNFFENSSHTVVLRDPGGVRRFSVFVDDGGSGDQANDAGTAIVPDLTIEPLDGGGLAAGYALLPDGGASLLVLDDAVPAPDATPGTANPTFQGDLALDLDLATLPEDGSQTITGTVTLPGVADAERVVQVTIDDESEARAGSRVVIPPGQTQGTFTIVAVDDAWPDGDRTVRIRAEAATYGAAGADFTVTDDDQDFLLVINEAYRHIDGLPSDANGDGRGDGDDEFVEILNVSGARLDLSGVTLATASLDRHVFPFGTVLDDGCAIVVFAGGGVEAGSTAAFGNTPVQIAHHNPAFPGLHLDEHGDTLSLVDTFGHLATAGAELHSITLPPTGDAATSWMAASDDQPGSGYVEHRTLPGGSPHSPGTAADGSPFCPLADQLVLQLSGDPLHEGDGFVTAAGTVSLPAPAGDDLFVWIDSSDASEIDTSLTSPVLIPAGARSAEFALEVVDDPDADGSQELRLTARAAGFLNGAVTTRVLDDADTPPFTDLVINEVDAQTPGVDREEFVELYNRSSTDQSLHGLVLVFFNGNGDRSYAAHSLDGFTIPAQGYFVIGSAGVPRVDFPSLGEGSLQNGPDAVALFAGSLEDFPDGTPVGSAVGTLIDAVVHDDGDGHDEELLAALAPGSVMVSEGGNGAADHDSAARVPDGGPAFDGARFRSVPATPGAPNASAPVTGYDAWAEGVGLLGSREDDEDGDGLGNLVEFALGLDPHVPDLSPGRFDGTTLSFAKHPEAAVRDGLHYSIETSPNLGPPWTTVVASEDAASISYTLPPGAVRLFARLRVEESDAAASLRD